MRIIVTGVQGSGKTTLAKILSKEHNYPVLDDLTYKVLKKGIDFGKYVDDLPDDTIFVINDWIFTHHDEIVLKKKYRFFWIEFPKTNKKRYFSMSYPNQYGIRHGRIAFTHDSIIETTSQKNTKVVDK